MRFIIFVIEDQSLPATSDEMASIDAFNELLVREGHWIMAAGIGRTGALIDNRDGAGKHDDSSLQSNEFYSGFWLIEAPDDSVASSLALAGSQACHRRVELRPFL